jgi:hypothetical protein
MAQYGTELGEMLRTTFGTEGLSPALKKRERRLRDQTAKAGLGSLTAEEENTVIAQMLVTIEQRLALLLLGTSRQLRRDLHHLVTFVGSR